MRLESQCTGHRQLRLQEPSPECDFCTPTTHSDLAVSLRAAVGGGNVVFGNDFFSAVVPGRELSFRHELLRHLAVLEERVVCVEKLPLEDERVLSLMQAPCSVLGCVGPDGLSEDALRASLEGCYDATRKESYEFILQDDYPVFYDPGSWGVFPGEV